MKFGFEKILGFHDSDKARIADFDLASYYMSDEDTRWASQQEYRDLDLSRLFQMNAEELITDDPNEREIPLIVASGSPHQLSPDVLRAQIFWFGRGKQKAYMPAKAGAAADLWSAACVLYQMITRRLPFEPGSMTVDRVVKLPAGCTLSMDQHFTIKGLLGHFSKYNGQILTGLSVDSGQKFSTGFSVDSGQIVAKGMQESLARGTCVIRVRDRGKFVEKWQSAQGAKVQLDEIKKFWDSERNFQNSPGNPLENLFPRENPFWRRLRDRKVSVSLLNFFRDVFAEDIHQRLRSFEDIKGHSYMQRDEIRSHFV